MNKPLIYWFRNDLRLHDLPALAAAAGSGRPIIPCYIFDEDAAGEWAPGGASRWWLHHSLRALATDLSALGGSLVLLRGDTRNRLRGLAEQSGAEEIFCSRQYDPWAVKLEQALHRELGDDGITLKRYPGALLFEPESIRNKSGLPFKVFTPFWRRCLEGAPSISPCCDLQQPQWHRKVLPGDDLDDWRLTPQKPDWAADWDQWWQPGTAGARNKLQRFLEGGLEHYDDGRDHPALECTARLSAHLHFGEISPREVWHTVQGASAGGSAVQSQADKFLSELGWREFSHHLLHHFPDIPERAFKPAFKKFPWLADNTRLQAWQTGQTGYPLVDAGMRELWNTGFMHNRVRMITASFLTKHLLIHWRQGAHWFWDTLVDADLANNSCGWQWVAGSGADAAPYFRIFNPIAQGQKFDAEGEYIRRWVPELAALPDRYIHCPWQAPQTVLDEAGVSLGSTYPRPIVDHGAARESALAAYAEVKNQA